MKRRNSWLAVAMVSIAIAALVLYLRSMPEHYNWNVNLRPEMDQPYDFSIFTQSMAESLDDRWSVISDVAPIKDSLAAEGSAILYITTAVRLDSAQVARMRNFAEAGGRVLISARQMEPLLQLLFEGCDSTGLLSHKRSKYALLSLYQFPDDSVKLNFVVRQKELRFPWSYFEEKGCLEQYGQAAGHFESIGRRYINLWHLPLGRGSLYLHTNPLVFANYHFIHEGSYTYVQHLISLLPAEHYYLLNPEFSFPNPNRTPPYSDGPLRYILSQQPLRWAWYTLLSLIVLFIAVYSRRKQRAIPVLNLPENELAMHVDLISAFYQKQKKHKYLVALEERMLKQHLYKHYGIPPRLGGVELAEAIHHSTSCTLQECRALIRMLEAAKNNSSLSDSDLVKIQEQLHQFYSKIA